MTSRMLQSVPPATLGIMALCCGVYLCQVVFDPDVHHYTMNPRMIVHLNEYYRFITSALFHGSLMHIGMNMMSTLAISTMLEKRNGTLSHGMTILWAILWTSSVYTIAALLLHLVLGRDHLMYQHSLGFSGVIFHLSVLECNVMPQHSRSIFGFVSVPAYLYPWALLIVLQFIMPNLSFMGHLAGILTGTLQYYRVLDFFLVSDAYLQEMETWPRLQWLVSRPTFCPTPQPVEDDHAVRRDPAVLLQSLRNCVATVGTFVYNVAETIKVCIFGRGRQANANIQLTVPSDAVDDFEQDDDWVGLPPMPAQTDRQVDSRIV